MADQRKKVMGKLAGKGGVKCQCCGPSPKEKKPFNRTVRRVEKQLVKKDIQEQTKEEE